MSHIGTIRIKSFGTLCPPNSLFQNDENVETQSFACQELLDSKSILHSDSYEANVEKRELNEECSLSLESFATGSDQITLTPSDCIDLTEDTIETPLKKEKISKKRTQRRTLSSTKRKESKSQNCLSSSSSNQQTLQSFFTPVATMRSHKKLETPLENNNDQMSLRSIFSPVATIKRAPKKLGKPLETNNENSLLPATRRQYDLRKSSLRRKLLKTDDDPHEIKKMKNTTAEFDEIKELESEDEAATSKNQIQKKRKSNNETKPKKKSNQRNRKEKTKSSETSINTEAEETKDTNIVDQPTVIPGVVDLCLDSDSEDEKKPLPKRPATVKSEKSICPSYKVIEGTTFAVDGFKYGRIEVVTAYFLTHYHADHYVGLTKRFSMPLYMSQITANLMREFIPVDEKFVNILPMNTPTMIEGVQVTAIDANHCPGAVLLLFELSNGTRILHTGDFRASIEMESDPFLKQRNIDLLYLDTTYISHNYSFQTQEKSIADALQHVRDFKERNKDQRILFVVGAYLVGKEKFWLPIAKEFDFKIWTDSNRRKIMKAIDNQEILQRLVSKPHEAELHIISMGKVGYRGIEAYWEEHCSAYDKVFAIRPSGWEKNSKPQFRGQLNIVGIEYSEHSSHNELRRFLSFLRPKQVISTVPNGKDLTKCPEVPLSWYKKECFSPIKKQASILDYLKSSNIDNKKC